MQQEILIIRLSSIGDIIHCTPVPAVLKQAWPDCRVTWLVGEVGADLLKYNPFIDELLVWPRERFDKYVRSLELNQAYSVWQELQQLLPDKSFDAVLDIHGLFLTGMIARQVRTKRRIGLRDARELNSVFMTETAAPIGSHITERYLGALTPLGIRPDQWEMILRISDADRDFAQVFLQKENVLSDELLAVLVPGTTWPTKNWPPEFFAVTAKRLGDRFKIVLCGGNNEIPLGEQISAQAGVPVSNAIGKTSLLQMAALLEQAEVVIAGDTGPLYMAAAIGVPTVGLFGPTDPEVYAPRGSKHTAIANRQSCSYCHKTKCPDHACMSSILPEQVVEAVYRVLH